MDTQNRIPTDGGAPLQNNPFATLGGGGSAPAPATPSIASQKPVPATAPAKNRGRVDVRRESAGRGGRDVIVVSGFQGIGLPEKEELARKMRKACGVGGTVKDGTIEIQGDKREMVFRILTDAGFRPVWTGG